MENYIKISKSKYNSLKLISSENLAIFKKQFSRKIGTFKELWNSFKCLDISNSAIKDNDTFTWGTSQL